MPKSVDGEIDIPSVDPRNSALANNPYNTIEKASDNIAKNISLYFLKNKPKTKT